MELVRREVRERGRDNLMDNFASLNISKQAHSILGWFARGWDMCAPTARTSWDERDDLLYQYITG